MPTDLETPTIAPEEPGLSPDFSLRLEESLCRADDTRRRRRITFLFTRLLPFVLLLGPIAAWSAGLAAPGGVHLGIDILAWVTFLLDVGVHVDAALLATTGLTWMPLVVTALLFALVTATLLTSGDEE